MKQIKITNENINQNVIDKQYEQIGIRMPEGTKFSINEGSEITMGSTGIYEINLVNTNSAISSLIFTEFLGEGYVDLVEKGYEGSLYGNVINPPKSIQKINGINAELHNEIKFIPGNGINIETNNNEIKIINNYPIGKTSVGSYGEVFNNYSKNEAIGIYSHAEGHTTKAVGYASHAEGYSSEANGDYSHAENYNTNANGNYSHAEGYGTNAVNTGSHAEGYYTIASGQVAHAEGSGNTALGNFAHVEGYGNTASASSAHVEGGYNQATDTAGYSHIEGTYNIAKAQNTHVEGRETIASSYCQHVSGKANIEDNKGKYACIVGNGTIATRDKEGNIIEETKRSNAHTLDWNGNAWYQGKVQAAGFIDAEGNPISGMAEIIEDTFMTDLEPGMYKVNAVDDSYGLWLDDAYWWCLYEGVINIAYSEYDNMYTWTFIGRDIMSGSTMATGKTSWEEADGYWYCNEWQDLYNTVESNYNRVNDLDSPDYITYPSTKAVVDYVNTKTAPKVFEKIATYTVEPDEDGNLPQKIVISKDANGNAFELTDIYCECYIGLTDGSKGRFYIMAGNRALIGNMNLGFTGTEFRYWHFRYDSYGEGNGGLASAPNYAMPSKMYPNVNLSGLFAQPIPVGTKMNINKVELVGQAPADGAKTFAEGTTITLWGVRK